ncbi:MAG: trehalose-phosphatase [Gammaproteobacteria bacterium]|nr:trehalose-phosphatase [Gammaproteobacteria bacterium]
MHGVDRDLALAAEPQEAAAEAHPPLLSLDSALFLDLDGTLTDYAPRPDRVVVPRALPGLLLALRARLGGAVGVITGRRLAQVDALLNPARLCGAGLHGAELRLNPRATPDAEADPVVARLARGLRERFAADPRVVVEDKGAALALHYRQAPERAEECQTALEALNPRGRFEVVVGSMVVEARPRSGHTGDALKTLLRHRPFAGRLPVFVGEDPATEDAVRMAQKLGGFGVKVGGGPSEARYRFAAVAQVHAWMRASLHALR